MTDKDKDLDLGDDEAKDAKEGEEEAPAKIENIPGQGLPTTENDPTQVPSLEEPAAEEEGEEEAPA